MKEISLSILSIAFMTGLYAQINLQSGSVKKSNDCAVKKIYANGTDFTTAKSAVIWSSDFSNASDWVIDHDAAVCSLDWQIGTPVCTGFFPMDKPPMSSAFNSTSASNGYALIDSDAYAGATSEEDSYITTTNAIDLNGFPNAIVEFETFYKRYQNERPYLVVGVGDGSGPASVVWPDLDVNTDISAMANVFEVFPNWPDITQTENPQLIQINISPALVGLNATELADIYIRLNWTGVWGYAWFVDDFSIHEQPADDIQNLHSWFIGQYNDGIEYGKTPVDQLDSAYLVGAEIFNYGFNDQTNIALTMDFGSFVSVGNHALLKSDSTVFLENQEIPALPVGVYSGTYTAVSDNETGGLNFSDNVGSRTFEITSSLGEYSVDGVDVYPPAELNLSSIGTNSFSTYVPGSEDGSIYATMYHIKENTYVSGLKIMLAANTVAGAELKGSIKDTSTFWNANMYSLYLTEERIISAGDITAGFVTLPFTNPITLDTGAYYAAVQCYSNGNLNDVRIIDDRTINQPVKASAIYLPADPELIYVYTNGNAFGIRMLMDGLVGINENTLSGVSVYPNPSEGIINITNVNGMSNTIAIYNMLGQEIFTKVSNSTTTVDLSANREGVYFVKVSNENGSLVEKVVIKE